MTFDSMCVSICVLLLVGVSWGPKSFKGKIHVNTTSDIRNDKEILRIYTLVILPCISLTCTCVRIQNILPW